jgi:ferritin-like metal-binding protein YciE
MSLDTLQQLLMDELNEIYSAEKQITRALSKMAKATRSAELKQAFQTHLEQTKGHIERLDQAFEMLGKKGRAKTCKAMQGLVEEGNEMLSETEKGDVRDAALISAAQRVEHYEMAAYGCVRNYARLLGHEDVAKLLEQTLEEEKAADEKLTKIAGQVNSQALKAA